MSPDSCDLIVVGAGIVGLAHAWAAARRGWRVTVVERDARCVGASVRNFGFVTVTGQGPQARRRALRSRALWQQAAAQAGIPVLQQGAWVCARRPEAVALLEAFARSPDGAGCQLLDGAEARRHWDGLHPDTRAVLRSPHELRVESLDALPRLARWLAEAHGVRFLWGEEVLAIDPPVVRTARRTLHAPRCVLCPGTALSGVAAPWLAQHALRFSRLQMLRLQAPPGPRLPAALLGDLSLARYAGFASLPEAAALHARLAAERPEALAHGVHVIAVQSADGSLVVGDSHHDEDAAGPAGPQPSEAVDALILAELDALLAPAPRRVLARWTGHYPVGHSEEVLVQPAGDGLRLVLVTSGTGASTAFALAEEVLDAW